VRLFVSVDAGATWQHVQSVVTAATRFTVRAPKDGEYWFAVRTLDSAGRLHPDGKITAELKVVVDTRSPTLELKLSRLADGKLQLAWKSDDDHLDVSSLVLEYQRRGDGNWQSLTVTPAPEGRTSWDVSQGGLIEVRGRIADYAANVAVANDSIRIAETQNSVPRPSVPDLDPDPIAGVLRNDSSGSGMSAGFPAPGDAASKTESGPGLNGFQAAQQASGATRHASSPRTESGPKIIGNQPGPSGVGRQPAPPYREFPGKEPSARPREPEIPKRLVNRTRFHLNYSVDKVGRSGVEAVELFITVSGGRKWYRYGADPNRKSPFAVVVPKDGEYGFAIRVRSGAGIADPPPRPGEKPAIVVVVDQTAPKVELLPILQGRGSDTDKFLIRWTMSDANPAEKPISIAYSESAEGPWKSISGWQAAKGSYLWTTTGDVPASVYVRLTARDAAGNVAAVQTQRPIIVDVVKPSARITNVDVAPN
jgi:hypothetical protein